jgi:hypothetical protein
MVFYFLTPPNFAGYSNRIVCSRGVVVRRQPSAGTFAVTSQQSTATG